MPRMQGFLVLLVAAAALAGCADEPTAEPTGPQDPVAPESDDQAPTQPPASPRPDAEPDVPPPTVTSWDLGQAIGCEGGLVSESCITFQEGPGSDPLDGHWIELGPSYWTYRITSTVDNVIGDSDCLFVGKGGGVLGNGHRGQDPCGGTIPQRTQWLFIYSYVEPAQGFHVEVKPPGGS